MEENELNYFLINQHQYENEEIKKLIHQKYLDGVVIDSNYVYVLEDDECFPNDKKIRFSLHPYIPIDSNATKITHRHSFIEMIYVYSGVCYQNINNETIILKQGSVCILDTNVAHSVNTTNANDIVINCLMRKSYFDTAFLVRLKNNDIFKGFLINTLYKLKSTQNYIIFNLDNDKTINTLFNKLLMEYYDPKMCSSEIIDSYMIILFAELLRIYNSSSPTRKHMTDKQSEILDIIEYIQKNYKNATLDSTSAHFNLTPKYLSSKIKKLTDHTFIEIIHQIQMEHACSLLLYTNIPIEQVAHEVGYSNINYFYQLFNKFYGTTPKVYKKIHTVSEPNNELIQFSSTNLKNYD